MRKHNLFLGLSLLLAVMLPAALGRAQEKSEAKTKKAVKGKTGSAGGAISGTIKIYRTRVKTKGVKSYKDVVVYLESVGTNNFPPPAKHAKMDQKALVYLPHVLPILKGTTVDFLNNDNDKHNVYLLHDSTGKTENVGTAQPHKVLIRKFTKRDVEIVLCKLHLEMAAYIIVLDNPYFTMTSIDGATQKASFTLSNVPPGTYKLNTWHKKLKLKGGSVDVVVEAGKTATADLVITKAKYAKRK